MAYGIYYRKKGSRSYQRAEEYVIPSRPPKMSFNGKVPRFIRCETVSEANAIAKPYADKGLEVIIKEVK